MIIVGEKFNSSIPKTFELMKSGDTDGLRALAALQESCGAAYIDINTAMFGKDELCMMKKMTELVIDSCGCGIMLDSADPEIIKEAVKFCGGREVIINSVTLCDRLDALKSTIAEYNTGVVGLPIDKDGTPKTAEKRTALALKMVETLRDCGVSDDKIYIDVLAEGVATDDGAAKVTIDTTAALKAKMPEIHTICGLSNVSFGLPKRSIINRSYLTMLMYAGLDSAIMDPSAKDMKESIAAASLMLGRDEFCMDYITCIRES